MKQEKEHEHIFVNLCTCLLSFVTAISFCIWQSQNKKIENIKDMVFNDVGSFRELQVQSLIMHNKIVDLQDKILILETQKQDTAETIKQKKSEKVKDEVRYFFDRDGLWKKVADTQFRIERTK